MKWVKSYKYREREKRARFFFRFIGGCFPPVFTRLLPLLRLSID